MGMIVSCLSNIMYLSEKITLYLTCTSLISCLVLMFVVTLGMGIGLGYNYCFVDMKTKHKYVPGHYIYPGSPRWPYKREGEARDDPEAEAVAEDDALRVSPILPDSVFTITSDPRRVNESMDDNQLVPAFHASSISVPDGNSSREYSIDTSVRAASSDESIEISENIYKTASSMAIVNSTEGKPEISDEIDEPTPESISSNDSNSRRVKKLVIPISGLDLISLLSKLRAENKNYSLQIVTT